MKIQLIGINSKYIHPANGVFQLVANSNYPVDFFEATIKDDINDIYSKVDKEANLIGISTYIWNVNKVVELIGLIKANQPNSLILIGGPESYFRSEFFLSELGCDFLINSEGEESFNELVEHLLNKRSITEVSNLFYKENNSVRFTFARLPDISKIKHDYSLIKDFKNRVCYLETSRGCFFKCSYCMASLETKVRFFDFEVVKKDIKYLMDNHAKTIKFLDRSFNVNKKYMLDVLKYLKEVDNSYTVFQFEIVGDMLDDEVIDYINNNIRKGYLRFEIGIQSVNDQTTKAVCRRQNFEKLASNIKRINDVVTVHTDLIAGLPFEDLESFKNTFNKSYLIFASELQLGFLKELKGTKISNEKSLHDYSFQQESPYEVISNKYITHDELEIIHEAEEGLEKYHNKGNFKKTMDYIFNTCMLDPFETFRLLYLNSGKNLRINHDEVALNLYNSLKDNPNIDSEYLLYLIKQDYLEKYTVRPKIWWERKITRNERNFIYDEFSHDLDLNIDILFNYATPIKYHNEYYIIIYKDVPFHYKKTINYTEGK